jgi:hypothetical protein
MLEKTNGISSNLEIMFYGFPKEQETFGQIQEKMV